MIHLSVGCFGVDRKPRVWFSMAWSRERIVLVPLILGVTLSMVILGTILYRSSFQLEALREQSLVEATLLLANEKADRLEQSIIDQDNTVLALTKKESPEQMGQRWLDVASVQTPSVRALLLVSLREPNHEVLAFVSRAPGPRDDRMRRQLLNILWDELVLDDTGPAVLRHLHTSLEGESVLLSYIPIKGPRAPQRLLVIWHDIPRIVHELFPSLYESNSQQLLRDEVRSANSQNYLKVRGDAASEQASRANVVDAQGRIIYGPPLSRGRLTLGVQFPTTLYKWRVNVNMAAAADLAQQVEQRRMIELGILATAAVVVLGGVIVMLIAAARERKLAMLKSEFVANVSHELKTPLSLVRMFSEMLLSGRAGPEKQKKYLEIIVGESERLTALIDNVLDFSRVERGRESYDFRKAELVDTISRAVDICGPRAEQQSVELSFSTDVSKEARTRLDERSLEIGLVNLIDNALKYAKGTPRVEVSLTLVRHHYQICVRDFGPGVPEQQSRRVFERFVRGDHPSGDRGRGSGIGLALVAQIARAHGGKAWVENAEPQGARFILSVRA